MASNANTAELQRQNEARLEEIENAIKETPLTSERRPLEALKAEYQSSETQFVQGIDALVNVQNYKNMRVIRRDGNCYYRAFLYSLVEGIREDPKEGQEVLNRIKKESWEKILEAGYDEMMIESFYETLVELLERVLGGTLDSDAFHKEMNEESGTSEYCTWFMRVIVATHLKGDPDRFSPFISTPGLDMEQFCKREVEPMGKECEQVQVLALAEALGVHVTVAYLDGHPLTDGKVSEHTFGPGNDSAIKVTALYRPGHYDILYK